MADNAVPPGGGTGVLDRQDEGYGGKRINLVLGFEGVFTVDKENAGHDHINEITLNLDGSDDGHTAHFYLNEITVEGLLKPLAAMKYFKIHWLSPWAEQIDRFFQEKEGMKPAETIPMADADFYRQYLEAADQQGETPTIDLPTVYKAFEFDHQPLAWIGTGLNMDAFRWSMFVRPNTFVHCVENPNMGISTEEANLVLSQIHRFLN